MGTEVQYKSHLTGYISMRDLNEDASTGSWSPFYEDKMFKNGQYCYGFTSFVHDGYSEYDKDALRQTMLHHEAIFRDQVYELHRLYRIQRDMMDEYQKKELFKYSMPGEASSYNLYPTHMPSGDTQRLWQTSAVPCLNSSYSKLSFLKAEDKQSPPQFPKESKVQFNVSPIKNGVHIYNCGSLDLKPKKFQKRTFDLQLPADVYVDSEDGEGFENGKSDEVPVETLYSQYKNFGTEHGNSVNLCLGTSHKHGLGDDKKKGLLFESSQKTHYLADLNEPIQGFCDEAEASTSANYSGSVARREEVCLQQQPMKQNGGIGDLSKDLFQDSHKCWVEWNQMNLLHSESEECKGERLSCNLKAGQSRTTPSSSTSAFGPEKLPLSSEQIQVDIKKAHELPKFLASDQGKRETWFGGKTTSTEPSHRNSALANSNTVDHLTAPRPPITSLFPAANCANDANTESPVLFRRSPTDNMAQVPLVAVQALPCLNGPLLLNGHNKSSNSWCGNSSISKERWDLNLKSHPGSSNDMRHSNFFNSAFQSDGNTSAKFPLTDVGKLNLNCADSSSCKPAAVPGKILKGMHCIDVKSAKDMNLNVPNGFRDGAISKVDLVIIDGPEKHEDQMKGLPWLRVKPTSVGSASFSGGLTQKDMGHSQVMSSCGSEKLPCHLKVKMENGPPSVFMKDSPLTLHTEDDEALVSKIFGFSVLRKPWSVKDPCPSSSFSMSCQNQSEITNSEYGFAAGLQRVAMSTKRAFLDLEKKPVVEDHVLEIECDSKSSTGSRHKFNLNFVAVASDEQPLELSEISCKNDVSAVPKAPAEFPNKIGSEIDLEAVVILPPPSKDIPTEDATFEANLAVKTVEPTNCKDENKDTLARVAAETILDMSSRAHSDSDDANCNLSSSALRDSLLWFSELISLSSHDLESVVATTNGNGNADDDLSDDGEDIFEAMTLKLTELKEEVCWRPLERENQKEEEMGASVLLTRRRTTRRRGRQRRDFQRDILPGLVSLSRHEVTEDLQTIGGLMKASGCLWQTGLARRNAARNGWNCQLRGRRRPRGAASAGTGNLVCLLPRQPSNGEMEPEGGISLQGWGKTRRCRRQRFPSGSTSAALT